MIRRAVIGLILLSFMTVPVSAQETVTGRASIVDGNTIDISGARIRLNGIDAPESWQKCRRADGSEYRCGAAAAFALDEFLAASRPTRAGRRRPLSPDRCQLLPRRWPERQRLACPHRQRRGLVSLQPRRIRRRAGRRGGGKAWNLAGSIRFTVRSTSFAQSSRCKLLKERSCSGT